MSTDLRILHVEDDEDDAFLITQTMEARGLRCEIERVQTRESFQEALEQGKFDLILSDFSLPKFNGLAALELAREMRPEIPFIFVSGTIGEEVAISALKSGATDYVLKDRLGRLVPAIRRALDDAAERAALKRAEEAMIQSEHKYRHLFEFLSEAALLTDSVSGRVLDTNHQAEVLFARPRSEIVGSNVMRLLSPEALEEYRRHIPAASQLNERVVFEGEIATSQGQPIPVSVSATPIILYGRRLVLALYRDITDRKQAEAEIQRLKEQLARGSGSP
ncbi:MAG TPA: response regulator [Chthoniobacter sp.]|jgi:PAS domain S-box-containing protein